MSIKYSERYLITKLFILIVSFVIPVHSQNITLRPIPSLDKLPVNAIHRIFQDSDGYMWYGTFNGLCRYDGYNIKVFRSDLFHPGLLSDNYITYIVEDHEKKIWFGTMKGAYILDKETYRITPVDMPGFSGRNVFTIHVTRDGTIWISVHGALLRFRSDGSLIKEYKIEYNLSPEFVYIIYEDKKGDLLISITQGGMYKLDKATDTFEAYFHHPDYMDIERIIWDETCQVYWLGTWGKGIVRFDPQSESEEERYVPQSLPVDILGTPVGNLFHMVQDDVFRYLWVTTQRDLFAFRITPDKMLEQINTSSFLPPGNKMLYEIYKDREGKLWVSAFDVESFIVDIRDYSVKEYSLPGLRNRIKANPAVTSLCIDTDGKFWFSQERYGLCVYDPETDRITHYWECKETSQLPFWEVPKLIGSRKPGRIWAMPHGSTVFGLMQHDMEMKEEVRINMGDVTADPGLSTALFEDDNNNLWIGTASGLFVYDTKSSSLHVALEKGGYIAGITQTADGNVWAAIKNKGLCRIDPDGNTNVYPFNKDFAGIDATSDGKLWTGTAEGEVLMFDPGQEEWEDYSFISGMKGDIINNITIDTYNHVWITTGRMIKEFNPRNNAYRIYNTRDRNFLLTRLLSQAIYYDKKGDLYFGGISGIVSIPPSQQLESIPEQVTAHITDIKIMGRSIWEDEHAENPIHDIIRISPDAQNLDIEFSSLDFHNPDQIRYAYRMIGIDNDWIYLDEGKNAAFYNKLSKGKYTFRVKATDKNGLWSDKVTEITIRRLPAVYETWWACLLYFVLAAGVVWIILYLYLQREKQENHKKLIEKVTQMKLRYFTSISHELLTPLTILSCLADEMESPVETDKKRVSLMQSNIKRLKRLLQQVLDFRKIESKNMKLYVSYGDITAFIRNICEDSFALLMKKKNITFSVISDPEKISGYFDHDKLDKILFNLLSNAFKYTPDGKTVIVEIRKNISFGHAYLRVKVKDEGKGIAPDESERIFSRFYTHKLNDAASSNGIGLSLSKELTELHHGKIEVKSQPGMGSEFTVEIPIDRESYTPEELRDILSEEEYLPGIRINEEVADVAGDPATQTGYTLMLVEDDPELLLLMESIFAKTYRVVKAENGKEALDRIRSYPPDIVISDIMMPEPDGLELCRQIKKNKDTAHIVVILLTAKTTTEDQIDSYEVGADDYIPKPFEPRVLRVRVQTLLEKQKRSRAEFKNNFKSDLISPTEFTSLDQQLIVKAVKVIEENLSDTTLDVAGLADKLNMSRSTFSRKIKTITGQTPLDFIKQIKMQHARQMLENKTSTVAEVIVALGYNDHKHFTSSFKKAFGITPGEYQKQKNPAEEKKNN